MTDMNTPSTAAIIQALDRTWSAIRERHPELPSAVAQLVGAPERGHLVWVGGARWSDAEDAGAVPELAVSSDLLARSAEEILAEILHAAAHAIGDARGVATLSRQGRYHSERFAEVARGVGLAPERDERQGWAATSLAVGTSVTYATELLELRELVQTLPRRQAEPSGRRSSNNGLVLVCACDQPRRIRAAASVADRGAITCGLCEQPFRQRDLVDQS